MGLEQLQCAGPQDSRVGSELDLPGFTVDIAIDRWGSKPDIWIVYSHIFTNVLSYLILYCIILYSVIFYYILLCHIISCYIILYHIIVYFNNFFWTPQLSCSAVGASHVIQPLPGGCWKLAPQPARAATEATRRAVNVGGCSKHLWELMIVRGFLKWRGTPKYMVDNGKSI